MRKIDKIIVHCSATREGQNVTTQDIRTWHMRDNKWNDIGYHYVIELDGTICKGRDESEIGAHVSGHNKDSIGICYVGGVDKDLKPKDTRTDAQKVSLKALLLDLKEQYPNATIHGHREFAAKACPSFDVEEYAGLGRDVPQDFDQWAKTGEIKPKQESWWVSWIKWLKKLAGATA